MSHEILSAADNHDNQPGDMPMFTIAKAVELFSSLEEMRDATTSWEGAMAATVEGTIDFDDIAPLVFQAAALADEFLTKNADLYSPPRWAYVVDYLVEQLTEAHMSPDGPTDELRQAFAKLGRVADLGEGMKR